MTLDVICQILRPLQVKVCTCQDRLMIKAICPLSVNDGTQLVTH